jgi:hypothetical protein
MTYDQLITGLGADGTPEAVAAMLWHHGKQSTERLLEAGGDLLYDAVTDAIMATEDRMGWGWAALLVRDSYSQPLARMGDLETTDRSRVQQIVHRVGRMDVVHLDDLDIYMVPLYHVVEIERLVDPEWVP